MTMPIDKNLILNKLDTLLELLNDIEGDIAPDSNHNELFSGQLITALTLKNIVKNDTYKQDGFSIVQIMKDANRIWKMGKLWKANGSNCADTMTTMNDDIEECLSNGHKINAIKIYRQQMNDVYGVKINLREAKDYIDNTLFHKLNLIIV